MSSDTPTPTVFWQRDTQLDRLGAALAQRLDDSMVSPDIAARLRVAREQAVAVAQAQRVKPSERPSWLHRIKIQLNGSASHCWNIAAVTTGAVAFAVSFFVVQGINQAKQTSELAEVDTELLTDDLPIEAYSDPAFMRFLRNTTDSDSNTK